jgi:alginate export protein
MKNVIKMSLATAMMMSLGTVSAQADDGISIFEDVKVSGEIRPRYEFVEEDNAKPNANALTNRLVLGVSADLLGTDWLSTYVEMTDVHNLNDNYNSTANGQPNSIVADPEQTRLTQSYLDLKYKKTKLRYGRQMFNLDNLRFIGAVAWRQMPQTYDATTIFDSSIEGLDLMASYVTQVNTITTATKDQDSVLLNAKYKAMDALTVTGYGYLLENFGDTYGIALTGKPKISDTLTLNYRAEYAMMGDASLTESPTALQENADADYYNLELGMNMSGILAGINYEVQSGDNDLTDGENNTFSTPYGTNHAHNGWADKFLATPTQGLVDLNVMVGYTNKELGVLKAIYHDFSSDVDSLDYGKEIDLLYKRAIPGVKGLVGMLKYADFNSDNSGATLTGGDVDTQKFWVMLDYKFSN